MRAYVIVGTAFALAITPALAGGKSGGGGHASTTQNNPQENISLNYGKIEHTYTQQKPDGAAKPTGKRIHQPITVTKKQDSSSSK